MAAFSNLTDDALIAFDHMVDKANTLFTPTIRLGVTGLSRAGKTVFISALVHNLLHGGRLPMFSAFSEGRLTKATLQPQPDDNIPRFQYEQHIKDLIEKRVWPEGTNKISELRVTLEFESASFWNKKFGAGKINLDIIDYPGEWLLDLPLLHKSFDEWSAESIALSKQDNRKHLAKHWHGLLGASSQATSQDDETIAREMAATFTHYLQKCRQDENALSSLPPGRFLMPGDLEGSPALTFAPLIKSAENENLHAMMKHRYEAYKTIVVKPFFRDHFSRLDRQIVLVDALHAMNAGSHAVKDLEHALGEILNCFRPGKASWLFSILGSRIERILFAATKADQLHHENHDRLEIFLNRLLKGAIERASYSGAKIDVAAISAIRATREGNIKEQGEELPVLIGTPIKGEKIGDEIFDGIEETAIFPGDLPKNPESLFDETRADEIDLNFVRFQPPELETTKTGIKLSTPHIRLDRSLEFLFGDVLK